MPTRCRDFQSAFDRFLSFHIREIRFFIVRLFENLLEIDSGRRNRRIPFQKSGRLAQIPNRNDVQPIDDRGFRRIFEGNNKTRPFVARACNAIGKTPLTGRSAPVSASSPTMT